MRASLTCTGDAPPAEVWRRYADLDAWSSWAPLISGVEADGRVLAEGLVGTVVGVGGVRVRFEVLDVDHESRSWRWRARLGPVQLELQHEVLAGPSGGTVAALDLVGAPHVVLGYLAPARLALGALVRPEPGGGFWQGLSRRRVGR